MDFDAGAAVLAGLIAGAIMIVPIYMGLVMMPSQMKMDILRLLGTMMFPLGAITYPVGIMTHAGASIGFALIHVAFFELFDLESNLAAWGVLFGAVHWAISGIGFGMMPMIHRGIRANAVPRPGLMASAFPPMTVAGFLMVHLLYGVLVGTFYELLR